MSDRSLDGWRGVLGDESLLRTLASASPSERSAPAFLTRLRESVSAERLSMGLELVEVRERAAEKFPKVEALFADRVALEQASGVRVAGHKAERFRRAVGDSGASVWDICCGAGGDLFALHEALGSRVRGVDLDPLRVEMAVTNTGAEVLCADLANLLEDQVIPADAFAHCDPARRSGSGRVWRLEDLVPSPDLVRRLIDRVQGAAIKLGPGTDVEELRPLGGEFEYEWIADGRALRQLVVWTGGLAEEPGRRRATRIGSFSFAGEAEELSPASGAVDPAFLIEMDPVVERAGLSGAALRAAGGGDPTRELHPGLGLFGSEAQLSSELLRCFPIAAEMPWRESKVRRALRDHGFGAVAVKTRGGFVDANALERAFRSVEGRDGVLFVLRLGTSARAFLCEPAPQRPSA